MTAVDIVMKHYAASDAGDPDGMTADFAPGIRWTEAAGFPYAGTYHGPDQVRAGVFERLPADFDDFQVLRDRFVRDAADDDSNGTVIMLGRYRGRGHVTGRAFECAVCHVWEIRDGAIVRFEQIVDSVPIVATLP